MFDLFLKLSTINKEGVKLLLKHSNDFKSSNRDLFNVAVFNEINKQRISIEFFIDCKHIHILVNLENKGNQLYLYFIDFLYNMLIYIPNRLWGVDRDVSHWVWNLENLVKCNPNHRLHVLVELEFVYHGLKNH